MFPILTKSKKAKTCPEELCIPTSTPLLTTTSVFHNVNVRKPRISSWGEKNVNKKEIFEGLHENIFKKEEKNVLSFDQDGAILSTPKEYVFTFLN